MSPPRVTQFGSCSEKCLSCPSRHVLRRSVIVRPQSRSRSLGQPGSHPELFAALRSRDRVTSLHVLSCLYRTLASHLAHKSNHTTRASVYVFTVAMPTPIDVTPRFVHCYSITLYHVITRPYVGTVWQLRLYPSCPRLRQVAGIGRRETTVDCGQWNINLSQS